MKFYSGFSLENEQCFFQSYIKKSEYTVCGFSYGAIKALRDITEKLAQGKRVDTLQLFSPAFFQTKSEQFRKLQTRSYTKNKEKYLSQFIVGCFAPYTSKELLHVETQLWELEELLNYKWVQSELQNLCNKGVVIEVYLGGEDKIIDVEAAREFFLHVGTVTYIKNANHFLQTN